MCHEQSGVFVIRSFNLVPVADPAVNFHFSIRGDAARVTLRRGDRDIQSVVMETVEARLLWKHLTGKCAVHDCESWRWFWGFWDTNSR